MRTPKGLTIGISPGAYEALHQMKKDLSTEEGEVDATFAEVIDDMIVSLKNMNTVISRYTWIRRETLTHLHDLREGDQTISDVIDRLLEDSWRLRDLEK